MRAIDIRQTVWGFDGQVVPHRFNVLSVFVDNTTSKPFDGDIKLEKRYVGNIVDAPLVESVYISPGSSRWVQFYPYLKSDLETWELSWDDGRPNRIELTNARVGKPATVLLEEPNSVPVTGGVIAVKRLRDDLFPSHSTATDALAIVLLDHVPRWDPARQRSFVDWLKRGGRVYLLGSAEGLKLEFTGDLQILNGTGDKRRVGSGMVYRLDRTRRELNADFVNQLIERDPAATDDGSAGETESLTNITEQNDSSVSADYNVQSRYNTWSHWDPESTFLSQLKEMSNPKHSWALISLLGFIYLFSVFPGTYLAARKSAGDFRVTFGFLLGTIFLFSLVFLFVGRRGYNEVTVVHSIAIARQQPGGKSLDITQWSNAFVTEGGDYVLDHPGTNRIYSTCQERERVQRDIRNGVDARLLADMPPFSSRPFLHRAVFVTRAIDLEIESWETVPDQAPAETLDLKFRRRLIKKPARELRQLRLQKGESFPAAATTVMALCGRRLYNLNDEGPRLVFGREIGFLRERLQVHDYSEYWSLASRRQFQSKIAPVSSSTSPISGSTSQGDPTTSEIFADTLFPLMARDLGLNHQRDVDEFVLPEDRVRLYVFAPLPEYMRVANPRFSRQEGMVLYSLDLFEPEKK